MIPLYSNMSNITKHIHRKGEEGVALIAALMVMLATTILAISAFYLSYHSLTSASVYQYRVSSIDAATAGLNQTYAQIQSSSPTSLPCTVSGQMTSTTPSKSTATYSVKISYYTSLPATGPGSCPVSSTPVAAQITSTGSVPSQSFSPRTMSSFVNISPAQTFSSAIFSNSTLQIGNHMTLSGGASNQGNVYSNGNVICGNNATIAGSVFTPHGSTTISGSCAVNQNVYSWGGISLGGSGSIAGNATVSDGGITMGNHSTIAGNASASSSITQSGASSIQGLITQYSSQILPPAQTLPPLNYSSAYNSWVAQNYTLNSVSTCTAAKALIEGWSPGNMPSRELIAINDPGCNLSFSGLTNLSFNHSLAIITNGNTSFSQNSNFSSSNNTQHQFAVIVPASTDCSTSGNISIGQHTTFSPPLTTFFYTPCNFTTSGYDQMTGSVYSNNVSIANQYDITYSPPSVPGSPPPASNAFNVDVAYQREVPPS